MKKLETIDQNFIKTLLDNLPQNIEELSVPKDKNNKKTLELISLAEEKDLTISFNTAKEIVQAFLETPFEGGRHQKRIDKINYD